MPALDPASETQATRWSLISQARGDSPDAFSALEQLTQQYRDPIRDYIAALGHAGEAEDLTQEFFTRKFLRESFLQSVHRGSGSFRTFLKLCVRRFVIDHHRRRRRPGEGPGSVSLDQATDPDQAPPELMSLEPAADRALDQAWARSVIHRSRTRLSAEFARAGKSHLGEHFLRELDQDPQALEHREIGVQLGLNPGAVTTSFYRFRQRLQYLVGEELAATVQDPSEVETERQHLRAAFAAVSVPTRLAPVS